MKFQSNTLFPIISKKELRELSTITHETLDVPVKKERKFTMVDLWNIQKQKKSFQVRQYLS